MTVPTWNLGFPSYTQTREQQLMRRRNQRISMCGQPHPDGAKSAFTGVLLTLMPYTLSNMTSFAPAEDAKLQAYYDEGLRSNIGHRFIRARTILLHHICRCDDIAKWQAHCLCTCGSCQEESRHSDPLSTSATFHHRLEQRQFPPEQKQTCNTIGIHT